MSLYSIALIVHFLCILLATSASAVAFANALNLRNAPTAEAALGLLAATRRMVPLFPISSLGLLLTGAWMTQADWTWTTPWILASIAGLLMIAALGSGVEGSRMRALTSELESAGLTGKARSMTRDPVAWSAKLGTLTLLVAVVIEMTSKPGARDAIIVLALALLAAPLLARPFWSARAPHPADLAAEQDG